MYNINNMVKKLTVRGDYMKYEDKTKNELINIIQNLHSRLKEEIRNCMGL